MPVPKRKLSRSNTRSRRAQWKAVPETLVNVTYQGVTYRVPARMVAALKGGHLDLETIPQGTSSKSR
jgi:large subunit ribosomal protein L32